jgi:hypothetical protein
VGVHLVFLLLQHVFGDGHFGWAFVAPEGLVVDKRFAVAVVLLVVVVRLGIRVLWSWRRVL